MSHCLGGILGAMNLPSNGKVDNRVLVLPCRLDGCAWEVGLDLVRFEKNEF